MTLPYIRKKKTTKNSMMDIPKPNSVVMKNILVSETGILQSIDFELYAEGYITFGIIMCLETEVEY